MSISSPENFNKLAFNAVKNADFEQARKQSSSGEPAYKTEANYQASFADIVAFSNKYTAAQKKSISRIIYHAKNTDGLLAAYAAWRYLVIDNGKTEKDLQIYPMNPGRGGGVEPRLGKLIRDGVFADQSVIILDLSYNEETLAALRASAKLLIVIDDHPTTTMKGEGVFVEPTKAACSTAWKFFYPTKPVPRLIQYADNSDRKLFLPFVHFSHYFNTGFSIRITNNFHISNADRKKVEGGIFNLINDFIDKGDDFANVFIFIGKYMEEFKDNVKDEIAANARARKFQGYTVGVLNFDSPALAKVVGRQIISNFQASGKAVDFVVLWGYHYTTDQYRIQLIDDHRQTALNMGAMAAKLGKLGGSSQGGGGTQHVGNFYWKKDIKDLFTKQLL